MIRSIKKTWFTWVHRRTRCFKTMIRIFNRYNFTFLIPSIVITATTSVIAFLAGSGLYDEVTNKNLAVTVGVIGIVSTALQTFNGSLNYSGKSTAHSIAYEEYDMLYTKIKFELLNPNKSILNPIEYFNETKNNIIEIKKKCNYIIPDLMVKFST